MIVVYLINKKLIKLQLGYTSSFKLQFHRCVKKSTFCTFFLNKLWKIFSRSFLEWKIVLQISCVLVEHISFHPFEYLGNPNAKFYSQVIEKLLFVILATKTHKKIWLFEEETALFIAPLTNHYGDENYTVFIHFLAVRMKS